MNAQDKAVLLDQTDVVQFVIIGEMGTAHRAHRVMVAQHCFSDIDTTPIGEKADSWKDIARDVVVYVRLRRNCFLPIEQQFRQVYP